MNVVFLFFLKRLFVKCMKKFLLKCFKLVFFKIICIIDCIEFFIEWFFILLV